MKISTKGRYALRLMAYLANIYLQEGTNQLVSLKEISKHEEISMKYLEQLVSKLNKDHLIQSVRGKSGGYTLVKEPNKYSLIEILESVEGDIACVACLERDANHCHRKESCLTFPLYEGLNHVIINYFQQYTLEDLALKRI